MGPKLDKARMEAGLLVEQYTNQPTLPRPSTREALEALQFAAQCPSLPMWVQQRIAIASATLAAITACAGFQTEKGE